VRRPAPAPARLFHGTDADFEQFSLDFAVQSDRASNGHLGVWLAVDHELASRFGSCCLTVEADFACVYQMPLSELSTLHHKMPDPGPDMDMRELERDYYAAVRERLSADGHDAIAVVELDGRVGMYIALQPERLRIVERVTLVPGMAASCGPR
jgi:hypothetical protein